MNDDMERVRLIECWLPLAHVLNREYGWGYDSATLELLILLAAPTLLGVCNAVEARAILLRVERKHRGGAL